MSAAEQLDLEKRKERAPVRRTAVIIIAALAGFWLTWSLVRPDPDVLDTFPDEIVGTWRSTDPRYEDRAISISEDAVRLDLGSAETADYRVGELRQIRVEGHVAYQLSYFTPEGETTLELRMMPDGSARLPNPPDVVWRREPR